MNKLIEEAFRQALRAIAITPYTKEDPELMNLVADIHSYLEKYSEKKN